MQFLRFDPRWLVLFPVVLGFPTAVRGNEEAPGSSEPCPHVHSKITDTDTVRENFIRLLSGKYKKISQIALMMESVGMDPRAVAVGDWGTKIPDIIARLVDGSNKAELIALARYDLPTRNENPEAVALFAAIQAMPERDLENPISEPVKGIGGESLDALALEFTSHLGTSYRDLSGFKELLDRAGIDSFDAQIWGPNNLARFRAIFARATKEELLALARSHLSLHPRNTRSLNLVDGLEKMPERKGERPLSSPHFIDGRSSLEPFARKAIPELVYLYPKKSDVHALIKSSGIHADTVEEWGSTPAEIFRRVFARGDKQEVMAVLSAHRRLYPGEPVVRDLLPQIEKTPEWPSPPGLRYPPRPTSSESLEQLARDFTNHFSHSYPNGVLIDRLGAAAKVNLIKMEAFADDAEGVFQKIFWMANKTELVALASAHVKENPKNVWARKMLESMEALPDAGWHFGNPRGGTFTDPAKLLQSHLDFAYRDLPSVEKLFREADMAESLPSGADSSTKIIAQRLMKASRAELVRLAKAHTRLFPDNREARGLALRLEAMP